MTDMWKKPSGLSPASYIQRARITNYGIDIGEKILYQFTEVES